MKRILSILLCVVFCLGFTGAAYADEAIILNIEDAAEITTDFSVVEGTVSSLCDSILFYLDGVKTDETENTDAFSFEVEKGSIYTGHHTFEIVAITADGTVYEKSVNVRAKETIETLAVSEDFNTYKSGDKFDSGMIAVRQTGQTAHTTSLEKTEGVNGGEDVAVRLYSSDIIKSSKPYINANFNMIKKVACIEFDIKLDNTNTQAYIEMQNGGGGSAAYYFEKGNKSYIFDQSGKFFAGETPYKAGVWYHLKGTIDFETKKQNLTVYDYESGETIKILDDALNTDIDCTQLKLCRVNLASPDKEGCGYTIDNFKVYGYENYNGIKDVKYQDSEGAEKVMVSTVKPSEVEKINVYLSDALLESADISKAVSLIADKGEVEFESAAYDKDKKCITIVSPKLREGEKHLIKISMSAFTETKLDENKGAGYAFKTGFEGFSVTDGEIYVNGSKYFVPAQFKNTNTVSAKAYVSAGASDESVIMVLTVRDGKKLVSMKAVEVTREAGKGDYAEVKVEGVGKVTQPQIQCMILDNFTLRQAKVPSISAN